MISSADSRKLPVEIDLPNGVSQGFQKAKDFWTETAGKAVNTITEATNQAIDSVTKTAERSKDSLDKTTEKAVDTVTETTSQAVNTLTTTAEQASNSLAETIEKTSNSLQDTIQEAERLNNVASESVQSAMNSFMDEWINSVKTWIDSHPVAFWMVQALLWAIDHPILALIIAVLSVFILWKLLKVLSSLVEKALVSTLQAPLKFGRFLLKASAKSLGRLGRFVTKQPVFDQEFQVNTLLDSAPQSFELAKNSQKERLADILTRLKAIRHEENQLLQEIAAMAALDEPAQEGMSQSSHSNQHLSSPSVLPGPIPGREA